jgi:hypothetical protein
VGSTAHGETLSDSERLQTDRQTANPAGKMIYRPPCKLIETRTRPRTKNEHPRRPGCVGRVQIICGSWRARLNAQSAHWHLFRPSVLSVPRIRPSDTSGLVGPSIDFAPQHNVTRRPAGFKMRKSTSNALLGMAVRLLLVVSDHPRPASAERHLSPVELNDKLLSSMPYPQTSADNKVVQLKGRHQERRSHVAVLRRVLSASSFSRRRPARGGPMPGTVSALTTAANVVATICPHGMLPLGKNNSNTRYVVCFDTA